MFAMRTRRKKAQIESQMFIYIFTLIVIGLLLYLGVKWLIDLSNKGNQVNVAQLKVDMENAFEEIKYNYGSWRYEEFLIPNGVNKICFLDKVPGFAIIGTYSF